MNGFLGTEASFASDVSLVMNIVLAVLAAFGSIQAHKQRFSKHCPIMAYAAMLNWLPILFVMVPAWVGVLSGAETLATGTFANVPIFHGIMGAFTQVLMTYTVVRMYWAKNLPPQKPLWLMRTTIALWMLTVVAGIGVYLVSYAA